MDIKQSFHEYLNAPFAETLAKDFQAAQAAVGAGPLGASSLQEVLDAITPERDHMAFAKKAGLFLSAAQQVLNADASLDLSALGDNRLDCIGAFGKGRSLTVKGDAGNYAGACMEAGTLTIEGAVEDYAGHGMKGGTIAIKGLAENHLGHSMVGGEILVARNAHDFIGNSMVGGRIVVQANVIPDETRWLLDLASAHDFIAGFQVDVGDWKQ